MLGHDEPSPDAKHLFRRCGPIWLTFAAAHAVAAKRGDPRDWWALAWLRGTEIATDALWAESPAVSRPGAKLGLRLAGVANVAMAAGFAWLSKALSGRRGLPSIRWSLRGLDDEGDEAWLIRGISRSSTAVPAATARSRSAPSTSSSSTCCASAAPTIITGTGAAPKSC